MKPNLKQIIQLKKGNINFYFCFQVCNILIFFLISVTYSAEAQEYATDRLFMKQYKKTKCINETEKIIRKIKKRTEMNLEQEVLLIQNIWVKLRSNLPLSLGEKQLLKDLKSNGFTSTKKPSKEILKHKVYQYRDLRMKCKQIR